jgi:hypothetical protein
MINIQNFAYVCNDCNVKYYNPLAAKYCCSDTCNKASLQQYLCFDESLVKIVVDENHNEILGSKNNEEFCSRSKK